MKLGLSRESSRKPTFNMLLVWTILFFVSMFGCIVLYPDGLVMETLRSLIQLDTKLYNNDLRLGSCIFLLIAGVSMFGVWYEVRPMDTAD